MQFNRREFLGQSMLMSAGVFTAGIHQGRLEAAPAQRPNILWITCEDLSPHLGCYGDPVARTPHLDGLASEGVRYLNAYSNAPVCAPARNTIITGMYAAMLGTSHMRSQRPMPDFVKGYPSYLRQSGYFTTNNSKTDYNTSSLKNTDLWDECDGKATYEHRQKPDQPFFAIFNFTITHESKLHKVEDKFNTHKTDPHAVILPPFMPDTEIIRKTIAKHYDLIEQLDDQVGEILNRLNELGFSEDTIVFFYGDHGGVYPRTKRFLLQSGTRVPLIIKFPPKYRHLAPKQPGESCDRLVCFADLGPTVLSLAGIKPPDYMQGRAFLGEFGQAEHDYLFHYADRFDSRYRMVRMICDKKYLYIRNFTPHRPRNEYNRYYYLSEAMRSWHSEYEAGKCNADQSRDFGWRAPEELYVLAEDPWQLHNVATLPQYEAVRKRMSLRLFDLMLTGRDIQVIPEPELVRRCGEGTPYEMVRRAEVDYSSILKAAFLASESNPEQYSSLIEMLDSEEAAIRYWGAMGLIFIKEAAIPARDQLMKRFVTDSSPCVRYAAAEALLCLKEPANTIIPEMLNDCQKCLGSPVGSSDFYRAIFLTDVLDNHWKECRPWINRIREFYITIQDQDKYDYVIRNLEYLVKMIESDGLWP